MSNTHPANELSDLIPPTVQATLLKTPKSIPLDNNIEQLTTLRSSPIYFWLTNWLQTIGHNLLKLNGAFNINQFDEELIKISPSIYISNLESKLINFISKSSSNDDSINALEIIKLNYSLTSDDLSQLEILYKLAKIASRKSYDSLRKAHDKSLNNNTHLIPIHQSNKANSLIQYYQSNSRLYKRILNFNPLPDLPKKTLLNQDLDPQIDSLICIIANIYQLDQEFKNLPLSVQRALDLDNIIETDLSWRKVALNRRRAIEMELLLANRKKSSRIEQREKRKNEEQMQQAEIQRQLDHLLEEESGHRRSARVKALESIPIVENKETREERLKRRRLEQDGGEQINEGEVINEKTLESVREEHFEDEDEDDYEDDYEVHDDDEEEPEEEQEEEEPDEAAADQNQNNRLDTELQVHGLQTNNNVLSSGHEEPAIINQVPTNTSIFTAPVGSAPAPAPAPPVAQNFMYQQQPIPSQPQFHPNGGAIPQSLPSQYQQQIPQLIPQQQQILSPPPLSHSHQQQFHHSVQMHPLQQFQPQQPLQQFQPQPQPQPQSQPQPQPQQQQHLPPFQQNGQPFNQQNNNHF